jgi:hypothetical protein
LNIGVHSRAREFRPRRIFVCEYGPEILVDAERFQHLALLLPFDALFMNGLEVLRFQTFKRSPGVGQIRNEQDCARS